MKTINNILLAASLFFTIVSCQQSNNQATANNQIEIKESQPSEMTNGQLINYINEKGTYQQILDYAKSVGISTKATTQQPDTTLALFEELGFGHEPTYHKFSQAIKPADSTLIRQALLQIADGKPVATVLASLEPNLTSYKHLKEHYSRLSAGIEIDSIRKIRLDSLKYVKEAMNAYRWIHRQSKGAGKMVVVNTRGAYLKGLDNTGDEQINMRVIVGKKESPTPAMDTYATNVVKYPYWNVPRSIIAKEMLPRIKKNIAYLKKNRLEVVNHKGKVIDPTQIDWQAVTEDNFPYGLRQTTGLNNSLGVVKVDIKNPYSIYLHDTNSRSLFTSDERWRSHGCVRLQKPAELANFLAGKEVVAEDITQKPVTEKQPEASKLEENVPVFIMYLGADVDETGNLKFFEDIYQWEGNKTYQKAGE